MKTNSIKSSPLIAVLIINLVLSGYLLYRQYLYIYEINSNFDFCNSIFGSTCDTILKGRFAWSYGVPIATWGIAYFSVLGLLISFDNQYSRVASTLISSAGLGVSICLIIFSSKYKLPNCIFCHLVNGLNLVIWCFIIFRNWQHFRKSKIISKYLFLLGLLVGIPAGYYVEKGQLNSIVSEIQSENTPFIQEYIGSTEFEIPAQDSIFIMGDDNNKINITVFSSFECPGCSTFNEIIHQILLKHGDQITLEYRNYPLGSVCNPLLEYDMQPNSCDAALAAIASGFQGKFWQFHDAIFNTTNVPDNTTLKEIAQNLDLDLKKWESDRLSDDASKVLMRDIFVATKLKVRSTPTVFINNKILNEITYDIVDKIIHHELGQ